MKMSLNIQNLYYKVLKSAEKIYFEGKLESNKNELKNPVLFNWWRLKHGKRI